MKRLLLESYDEILLIQSLPDSVEQLQKFNWPEVFQSIFSENEQNECVPPIVHSTEVALMILQVAWI